MKLTKKQIEKIKELLKAGKNPNEIAKLLGVARNTILWHMDKEYRTNLNSYYRKVKRHLKRKDYQREYHKKRYTEDQEFREKQIERSKEQRRRK